MLRGFTKSDRPPYYTERGKAVTDRQAYKVIDAELYI